jgi:hypothetical protein
LLTFSKEPPVQKTKMRKMRCFISCRKYWAFQCCPSPPKKSPVIARVRDCVSFLLCLSIFFVEKQNKTSRSWTWTHLTFSCQFLTEIFEIQKMRFYRNLKKKEHFEKCKQLLEYQYYLQHRHLRLYL